MKTFKDILVGLVRVYQAFLSPFFPQSCRFYPTCSDYTIEALRTHSLFYALYLSTKRILKCHPYHPGGYDPVLKTRIDGNG